MSSWQPIETAPKDGWILVWHTEYGGGITIAHRCEMATKPPTHSWYDHETMLAGVTHWMPLPEPPSPGQLGYPQRYAMDKDRIRFMFPGKTVSPTAVEAFIDVHLGKTGVHVMASDSIAVMPGAANTVEIKLIERP